MKLENPRFGDKNILTLVQDVNNFSKNYFLSNGASFNLNVEFNESKQSYLIHFTDIKGNVKDLRFYDTPENVIICKESDYKFECMVLSNFGTSLKSDICLNFVVFIDLKLKPNSLNSAHNLLFKHGQIFSYSKLLLITLLFSFFDGVYGDSYVNYLNEIIKSEDFSYRFMQFLSSYILVTFSQNILPPVSKNGKIRDEHMEIYQLCECFGAVGAFLLKAALSYCEKSYDSKEEFVRNVWGGYGLAAAVYFIVHIATYFIKYEEKMFSKLVQ
uniref:Uncharacterized protein n=1 Tax=Panagrolaimus sp. ES5 TaxID=591445 RepID=A0AC34FIX4_9BILA